MLSIKTQRHDIQGNILRAYGFPFARYEIVRIVDPAGARRLLKALLDQQLVTTAETWAPDSKPGSTLNIFVSWAGLRAIGLKTASLDSFPEEFRQGMAARWRILGDPDPVGWEFGADAEQMHVFFAVYGRAADNREKMLQTLRDELAKVGAAVEIVHRQDAAMMQNRREHFGFRDGFGQPAIEGSGAPEYPGDGTPLADGSWAPVRSGEFVLGYENETGSLGEMPTPDALSRNGSFLVYRKLQQNVAAFRTFLHAQATRIYGSDTSENTARLAATLIGRWRSGCPLALSPEHDDESIAASWGRNNDFRYGNDPRGAICPIGAHNRRMNPRDGLTGAGDSLVSTHRIIRRGLPYGAWLEGENDDGQERGVAFMAINASLHYQFETLQVEWANSGEFAHLDQSEIDPLFGEPRAGSLFRIPKSGPGATKIRNLPSFVTLRGGGYFFIPSITALRFIAAL